MIVVTLPVPPSVNALFFNAKKGRVRTSIYNDWRNEAGWMLKQQKAKAITGPVSIAYQVEDKGRFDLGNIEKAITDLLVTHGMIEGDDRAVVRKISMEWVSGISGCRVTVKPEGAV